MTALAEGMLPVTTGGIPLYVGVSAFKAIGIRHQGPLPSEPSKATYTGRRRRTRLGAEGAACAVRPVGIRPAGLSHGWGVLRRERVRHRCRTVHPERGLAMVSASAIGFVGCGAAGTSPLCGQRR